MEGPVHEQDQLSTTDPDSTYATKGGTPARLGYYDNYLVDNDSCVIVGVQATAARMSQETVAAQDMLTRFAAWRGQKPESVAADTTYGNGSFYNGCRIAASLPICARVTVSTERTVRSTAPSILRISRKATVIVVQRESNSTTVVATSEIAPTPTSGHGSAAVLVRSKRNARAELFVFWPSTWMSQLGNVPASWPKQQSSPGPNGRGKK